jgi:hypothetical protein
VDEAASSGQRRSTFGTLHPQRFGDHASANDLFMTLMQLMGFDDVHSFGMKELCSGPLTGLA